MFLRQHLTWLERNFLCSNGSSTYGDESKWQEMDFPNSLMQGFLRPPYIRNSTQTFKAVVHQTIVQTISVCLHFCMKQNSLPEKGEIIGTGRTYMNLNFAGRFPAEIVWTIGWCTTALRANHILCRGDCEPYKEQLQLFHVTDVVQHWICIRPFSHV